MYKKKEPTKRKCKGCGKDFVSGISGKKFCAPPCYKLSQDWATGEFKLPTATVGAINEFRVCIDLLAKGYEVFRAVSPACSCDLAILKEGRLLRVEATTGYWNEAKQRAMHPKKMNGKFDVLAVVLKGGSIHYTPKDFVEYPPAIGKP